MLFQHGDMLAYRERHFDLIDQPLEPYFSMIGHRPDFLRNGDGSRGYVAGWTVEDGWLFLTGLHAAWQDATPVGLQQLFPFGGKKVFAAWFTGQLRGHRNEGQLATVPTSSRSPDIVLNVQCGRLQASSVVHRPVTRPFGAMRSPDQSAAVINLHRRGPALQTRSS